MSDDLFSWDLRQFFGANFHQDYDLVADDWQGLVDCYVRDSHSSAERLRNLAAEIETLPRSHDEPQLEHLVSDTLRVDYDPQPVPYAIWLGQIAERLRARAAEINGAKVRRSEERQLDDKGLE